MNGDVVCATAIKSVAATGVTLLLAALAAEVPKTFVAVTVNVYAVLVVKPVTVNGDAEPVAVKPPGLDVTVQLVMGEPFAFPGVKST